MAAPQTVLVTGATGTVGRELIAELARSDVRIRALSRDPHASVPAAVQLVVGDFADAQSLDRAMTGLDRVFLVTSGARIAEHDAAAIDAARRAGVRHVVKLSALGVGRGGHDPITEWHRAGERHLRASGLAWTVLRPTGFMSNALGWAYSIRATGSVAAPFPDGRTAVIDPRDIARVAALALTHDGHDRSVYELTGPEALRPCDQVGILAKVLDRPIAYTPIEPQAARSQLEQYGMPHTLADAVIQLLASAHEPWNGQPLATVHELTGHPPTDFGAWAREHRASFG
jgi:uncharacterized protein YbjT (DUF2867 family)